MGNRLPVFVDGALVMEAQLITCISNARYQTYSLFEAYVTLLMGIPVPSSFRF